MFSKYEYMLGTGLYNLWKNNWMVNDNGTQVKLDTRTIMMHRQTIGEKRAMFNYMLSKMTPEQKVDFKAVMAEDNGLGYCVGIHIRDSDRKSFTEWWIAETERVDKATKSPAYITKQIDYYQHRVNHLQRLIYSDPYMWDADMRLLINRQKYAKRMLRHYQGMQNG